MRIGALATCGIALIFAGPLAAQQRRTEAATPSVELALSNHTLQARYRTPTDIGGQEHSEISYAIFLSEGRDVVGSAALLMGADLNLGPLLIQIGPQVYAALLSEENNDVFAVSIGVQARYDLIHSRGIAVVGSAFYAPDVLTFGSADKLTDFMARAEMRLGTRLIGFAGYRWLKLNLVNEPSRRLQNELFAGINWQMH